MVGVRVGVSDSSGASEESDPLETSGVSVAGGGSSPVVSLFAAVGALHARLTRINAETKRRILVYIQFFCSGEKIFFISPPSISFYNSSRAVSKLSNRFFGITEYAKPKP
jgi:hypothetical protein